MRGWFDFIRERDKGKEFNPQSDFQTRTLPAGDRRSGIFIASLRFNFVLVCSVSKRPEANSGFFVVLKPRPAPASIGFRDESQPRPGRDAYLEVEGAAFLAVA
jgi:hypothetical protein